MKDIKDLPKKIPSDKYEFEFKEKGSMTGQEFSGKFIFMVPTIKEITKTGKLEASLNDGLEDILSSDILNLHAKIAYLRYALIEFPDFWKNSEYGYTLRDMNIVEKLYDICINYENDWLEQIWGKEEGKDGAKE